MNGSWENNSGRGPLCALTECGEFVLFGAVDGSRASCVSEVHVVRCSYVDYDPEPNGATPWDAALRRSRMMLTVESHW